MATDGTTQLRTHLLTFLVLGAAFGLLAGTVIARQILTADPLLGAAGFGERMTLIADLMAVYGVLGALGGGAVFVLWLVAGRFFGRRADTASEKRRWSVRLLASLLAATFVLALWTAVGGRRSAEAAKPPPPTAMKPDEEPPPLVLLLIDGADLDDMILPMVEAGELPTFRRLMKTGTWGSLASSVPTLSPILWTTIATGKPAREHGIRDFTYFHFPGFDRPVSRLPRGSGLRHQLFPLLERVPGLGFRRVPYTNDLRRSRALWEIVGEVYPVGVYHWLITWPAEEVPGFMMSGGVYAGPGGWHPLARDWLRGLDRRAPGALDTLGRHPPDIEVPERRRRQLGRLEDYLRPGETVERSHSGVKLITRSLRDPTVYELPHLMRQYRPRFTAAAFYSVDSFQHHFTEDRQSGGVFADAVAERYRFTDRMLGRFLKTLEKKSHVIVISDHGYDFELNHHWQAPAGVFFARGPAFARGRRFDSLNISDLAPLCLYLLGLPLPDDMPGTAAGTYREAVRSAFARAHPPSTIPTWERGPRQQRAVDAILDDQLRRDLEALGYL